MQTAPPFLGLSPGTKIPQQAVPDAIVAGPGGAFYVATLTGFPFTVGTAAVYKIVPGHAPQVVAGGFTNIIDIACDRWGNVYVLEIAKNGLLGNDPTGSLIKIDPQGHRTEIAAGQLVAPSGLAIAHDGTIYVTTNSVSATDGQLVKITQ
jgi:streptogramin lyase